MSAGSNLAPTYTEIWKMFQLFLTDFPKRQKASLIQFSYVFGILRGLFSVSNFERWGRKSYEVCKQSFEPLSIVFVLSFII